jgi:uncharacterized protein YndB with AHSA1/START domain
MGTNGMGTSDIVQLVGCATLELQLPVSPGEAWDALTDPELLGRWLADEVAFDLRPGGEGRLVFWWAQDGEPASRVELELTPSDRGGSVLRVVEARPLEVLDLVGIPLQGPGGGAYGPALVAA